jgi:hypothetical protein
MKLKRIWKRGKCDRCGVATFIRRWCGVAVLCDKCIKIAEEESGDSDTTNASGKGSEV